jgi:hypothetical protein
MKSNRHVIDGVTYVEVSREAKVGDKIYSDWSNEIYTVEDVTENLAVITKEGQLGHLSGFYHGTYGVIEPLSTVDTTQASPAVIDMFTALSRKIVSLETQLRDTQNNLEKQAIELENARHRIAKHADRFAAVEDKVEMLIDDTCELDERSQVLNAINKYYAEVYR